MSFNVVRVCGMRHHHHYHCARRVDERGIDAALVVHRIGIDNYDALEVPRACRAGRIGSYVVAGDPIVSAAHDPDAGVAKELDVEPKHLIAASSFS